MKTEELESLLEAQTETQTAEFKCADDWSVTKLAKDILAMSNVQDGGRIIIGVEDKTFARQGVTPDQKSTYNADIMKDQMSAYADPHVNFSVDLATDRTGLEYVVIRIYPFEEIPVICRKDSNDTRGGVIYYRNKNRRIESAAVSNSYDMRDIIELATVRMMQRKQRFGYVVESSDKRKFDDELKGL